MQLASDDPQEVAAAFELPLTLAEKLVEKNKAAKANPLEAIHNAAKTLEGGILANLLGKATDAEKPALYDKAFEFVAASGNEAPEALAEKLGISTAQAAVLIEEMRLRGDIASEDDSNETDTNDADCEDADDEFEEDDDDADLSDLPEKVIEAVCFVGDVIQDTSEKICDALDETVERIQSHDFKF